MEDEDEQSWVVPLEDAPGEIDDEDEGHQVLFSWREDKTCGRTVTGQMGIKELS